MKKPTNEEVAAIVEELNELCGGRGRDTELDHIRSDEILCDLLCRLGYGQVVEAFNNGSKWYA